MIGASASVMMQGQGSVDFSFLEEYTQRFSDLAGQTTETQWLVAFFVMAISDVCWALYTKATATSNPVPASLWAVALFLMGGVAVVGYTTNPILLIPSAIGAFVGTYVGVSFSNKGNK